MKIEVEKCIKEDGETWYYVKVNGLSQIATQDKDKAISVAKIYELNYKKFGSINPSIIIHSVEL